MLWARTLYQGWGILTPDYTFEDIYLAMRIDTAEKERYQYELKKARERG